MTTAATSTLDPELPVVQAIVQGDKDAFAEFVRRQGQWVRGVVFGVLGDPEQTEDVCQKVWMVVWQRIGTLHETERWRSWLYRAARHAALDAGREITRHRRLKNDFAKESRLLEARSRRTPHTPHQEQRELVGEAVRGLPALYREPFVLRHLEGWSYKEIAEVMSIPVDTVETRLVRARRHLREALASKI